MTIRAPKPAPLPASSQGAEPDGQSAAAAARLFSYQSAREICIRRRSILPEWKNPVEEQWAKEGPRPVKP